jgi:hypothetical protein
VHFVTPRARSLERVQDPYLVTGMIFDTCLLDAKYADIWPQPANPTMGRRRSSLRKLAGAVSSVSKSVERRVSQEVRKSMGRVSKSVERKAIEAPKPDSPNGSSVDVSEPSEDAGLPRATSPANPKSKVAGGKRKAGCAVIM